MYELVERSVCPKFRSRVALCICPWVVIQLCDKVDGKNVGSFRGGIQQGNGRVSPPLYCQLLHIVCESGNLQSKQYVQWTCSPYMVELLTWSDFRISSLRPVLLICDDRNGQL